jgi:hypothetical protein
MAIYKRATIDNGQDYPRYAILRTREGSNMPFYNFHVVITSSDNNKWHCTIVNRPNIENFGFKKSQFEIEQLGPLAELYHNETI